MTVEKFESEINLLRDEILGLKVHQEDLMENFRDDLDDIKAMLHQMLTGGRGGGGPGAGSGGMGNSGGQNFPTLFHREPGK